MIVKHVFKGAALGVACAAGLVMAAGEAEGQGRGVSAAQAEYRTTGRARTLREGGATVYPYGHSQPVLRCAPLRACTIELPVGEPVRSRMLGDTERWIVQPATGPMGSTLIGVKPTECNITTNLVISTDRRVYHVTLDAPPCRGAEDGENPDLAYMRSIRFYFPDDFVEEVARADSIAVVARVAEDAAVIPVASRGADPTAMNFAYRWQRDRRFPWVPAQVFDDGVQTFIRLPEQARHEEAPVLFELGDGGEMQILNYAVRGDYYVADRVLRRAVLVVGRGGPEQRLLIVNSARAQRTR